MDPPPKPATTSKDEYGYSQHFLQNQTMHVNHPEDAFRFPDMRMGIDQYPESYERSKLVEQDLDVSQTSEEPKDGPKMVGPKFMAVKGDADKRATPASIVKDTPTENASKSKHSSEARSKEDAKRMPPPATPRRARSGEAVRAQTSPPRPNPDRTEYHLTKAVEEARAQHARESAVRVEDRMETLTARQLQGERMMETLPRTGRMLQESIAAQQIADARVQAAGGNRAGAEDEDEEEFAVQQRSIEPRISQTPILPGFVRIVPADESMRIRHDTPVVCVNHYKYVQLDNQHLVPAWTDPRLVDGDNTTIRIPANADWDGEKRGGRPRVLCYLLPQGSWEFTPERNRPKKPPVAFQPEIYHGHIVINGRDKALKASFIMPLRCSTDIEGWEMEALYRYDTNLCHQDFIDRMVAKLPAGKSLPTSGTLNHRRRRDRLKMRVVSWPTPNHLSYSDQQIFKELGPVGVTQNITWLLEDLTKEQIEMHAAITYGGHLERSGGKAHDYQTRLSRFRHNLRLVRSRYADNTEEVRLVLANIAIGLETMGFELKPEEWARGINGV